MEAPARQFQLHLNNEHFTPISVLAIAHNENVDAAVLLSRRGHTVVM